MTPSFNLILRHCNNRVTCIKCQRHEIIVGDVKCDLELLAGLPSEEVKLNTADGRPIDDATILRFGENIRDNEVLKAEVTSKDLLDFYLIVSTERPSEERSHLLKQILERIQPGIQPLKREQNHDHTIGTLFYVLFSAAFHGDTDICDVTISKGASVDQSTAHGNTALHAAVAQDKVTTALYLQARGASLEQRNRHGQTVLDIARDFGACTSSNKLRLAQRARRKAEVFKKADARLGCTPANLSGRKTKIQQHKPMLKVESSGAEYDKHMYEKLLDEHCLKSTIERENINSRKYEDEKDDGSKLKTQTVRRVNKKANRTQSAPLMRGRRLKKNDIMQEQSQKKLQHNFLRLSRPQYIQYIKSSTGVVEEDYFADIFPQNDSSKPKRWNKKKHADCEAEREGRALQPSPPKSSKERSQCVGPHLMIGDTSGGVIKSQDVGDYLNAYQKTRRVKSAVPTTRRGQLLSYEEWVASKSAEVMPKTPAEKSKRTKTAELTRKIDYTSWLIKANKRLELQAKTRQEEERKQREFNQWIKEVKEDAGIYQYWKKQKEAQTQKQLKEQKKLRELERKKREEKSERAQFSCEVYQDWLVRHEMEKIKLEEQQHQREREKLRPIKQVSKI